MAARCKSCNAPIAWRRTTADRRIPLQASEDGTPVGHDDTGLAGRIQRDHEEITLDGIGQMIVRVLPAGVPADPDLPIWLSHFVDCPNADTHRR